MAHSIDGKEIILLGDMTTHGGKVMTASGTLTCMGSPVARVGDMVLCPLCKGMFPIVEGAQTALDNGKKIARHGDKVACGATLISRGI
ncbi:PAAR domain-containing protein [uncultured Desulfovibrio sp.]|uniref:PAAR domain-containing protein n=1 Tax=uncultured Desulfovibrio sp. TaxID=167968 RepID=UPI002607C2D3|nr:PAAR domain-containing protein [uncultured Desulfovibrio sp.]